MNDKKPLLILSGPTAVGKTSLSVKMASAFKGEIISADSMQVYKYMDIGSAKIRKDEMCGINHYLIDILDPHEDFNVAYFKDEALKAMDRIYENGNIPIVTGGTGFYVQALLYDIDFDTSEGKDTSIREELMNIYQNEGPDKLYELLSSLDPKACEYIHKNNVKRVIRAIEFNRETGLLISEHNETMHAKESDYNFLYLVLNDDREKVYERIDKRVDIMIENGLVDEVRRLMDMGLDPDVNISMKGLGYKEIYSYLKGNISLDEAIYIIKRDTRHFAKKQITWYKREKEVTWINKKDFDYDEDKILDYIGNLMQERNIIIKN